MMTEREKMLARENKILINCLKVAAQLMQAQEDIQAERKRLAHLAMERFKNEVKLEPCSLNPEPCSLNLTPGVWRYNDVCLCKGKSYSTSGICACCGKRVSPC